MAFERVTDTSAPIFKGSPPEFHTDDSIDTWLIGNLGWTEDPSPRPRLYASGLTCAREAFFLANNKTIENTFDAASAFYMNIGNAIEETLATGLYKNGNLVFSNFRILPMPYPEVSGKIDLVVIGPEGRPIIIEVKSCGKLPVEPKIRHRDQHMLYAAISGFDEAYITYVSRNVREGWGSDVSMRTFQLDTSRENLQDRLEVATIAQLAIDKGKAPPVPSHFRKTIECQYCIFQDRCWDGRETLTDEEMRFEELEGEDLEELRLEAEKIVYERMLERPMRYYQTLRHLYKNTSSEETKKALKEEGLKAKALIRSLES